MNNIDITVDDAILMLDSMRLRMGYLFDMRTNAQTEPPKQRFSQTIKELHEAIKRLEVKLEGKV